MSLELKREMPGEHKRIQGPDVLRGIASLAVCWFHLTSITYGEKLTGGFYELLVLSGKYGWLGVEVFFVISGFVIPYSLHRAGYRIREYPTFILKRIARLDPPYIVSIAIILMLAFGYAIYSGRPALVEGAPIDVTRVLLHLGYINMFFGYEWLNPGYWTLAIEFQYYLIMGLAFPLFISRKRFVRLGVLLGFGVLWFTSGHKLLSGGVPYSTFIFYFIFLFFMGIITFQHWVGIIRRTEYLCLLLLTTLGCYVTQGLPATIAGVTAVLVINFYNRKNVILTFFGNISFSLYLLHWPIGYLTMSLLGDKLLKAEGSATRTLVLLAGLGMSIASALLLYIFVERPAQQWSSRFRYRKTQTSQPVALGADGELSLAER